MRIYNHKTKVGIITNGRNGTTTITSSTGITKCPSPDKCICQGDWSHIYPIDIEDYTLYYIIRNPIARYISGFPMMYKCLLTDIILSDDYTTEVILNSTGWRSSTYWVAIMDKIHKVFNGDWGCCGEYHISNWMDEIPNDGNCVDLSDLTPFLKMLSLDIIRERGSLDKEEVEAAFANTVHHDSLMAYLEPEITRYNNLMVTRRLLFKTD